MSETASGIDVAQLSPDIRPQDDLFRHVHERWMAATPVPADKARWGSFAMLAEKAEQAVQEIILESQDAEPGTERRKVGDLYASFMDEERIEMAGIQPIRPLLERIDAVRSIPEFLTLLGELEAQGGPSLLALFIDTDPGDPSRYIVYAEQAGIGLPDESYYREEAFAGLREQYLAYLATMFGHLGEADADAQAALVFALETDVAAAHWSNVATRDAHATYNLQHPGEEYPFLAPYFAAIEAPEGAFDEVVVREPSFVAALGELLREERLGDWLAWLRVSTLRAYAPYLTRRIVADNFAFVGTALTGATEQRARWKRGVSFVEHAMGDAVGRVYAERTFTPAARAAMDDLIANLVWAYERSIRDLTWMSEETKERALAKLASFTPKIGAPDTWRDYANLEVGADLVANARAAHAFEHRRELAKLASPVDRDEWFMHPQTVNAYYNPGFNEIVFPAAILQPPFFDASWDAAAIYGAIGAVIGHEIGHGFDDQGSRYDGEGRLIDWWSEADRAAFEERTSVLIAQFDELEPSDAPGTRVNGALTIGENIGDLGGLGIAWKAYEHSLGGAEAPVIDGLTGPQRFFLAWAQVWQLVIRPEEAARLVQIDPHAPNEFRANQIVRNVDAFYEAFGVTPSDALYLDPAARVTIW